MQVPRDPKCLHWFWPCRICTYVIVLKRCECCVFILGESIVFVHCNLFAGIIVELKWQKHQRLKMSVLVTHSALQMRVGFFFFYVFITSLKKKNLWSEENVYLNKLCNVKVLSSHAFCMISLSLRGAWCRWTWWIKKMIKKLWLCRPLILVT